MATYNTVKTRKVVNQDVDRLARQLIDSCTFLVPDSPICKPGTQTDMDIDLALANVGVDEELRTPGEVLGALEDFSAEFLDIMIINGPTPDALAAIEAE